MRHVVGYSPEIARTGFTLLMVRALRGAASNTRLVAFVAHHSCAYREVGLRELSAELTEWTD